jgi:hypothetical protein
MAPICEGDCKKTISTMEDWMIHLATPHIHDGKLRVTRQSFKGVSHLLESKKSPA